MAEVLSQSEIDALLQAVSSGEVDVEEIQEEENFNKVKKYDFRNPQKIAKDQLRTLEIIHENFTRLFQTFLSGYLRAPVKTSILTVDQYAYSEFSNAISNPAFLSIINFNPLNGQILIDMSTNIVFTIIDRLLGGDGEEIDETRSFTEIEISLLQGMMNRVIGLLKEAWENVIELKPSLEKIEVNSQFAQIVPPNETVALVTLNISIGDVEGMINICIPYIVLEPILDKLSTKFWFSSARKEISKKDLEVMKERILETSVPVQAELGSTIIRVKDILNIQIGDVIKLNYNNNLIKMRIGSKVKFLGTPGVSNNNMAVKIVKAVKDGEGNNE
ncbi:flagellar motor switch protein FliM [Anaerosalibacter massiliensis]|uniref:Flagellar motor switch protein FliM n=1 Tax=Anaerosalibacter massiliensis TaxID=1347392 RepID=A0A9X2MGG7_9FIRM|nr:flagellar motor switch protein FliM [Anaerosalibacter massiliensis]MCR2042762.1 flagellar motor switch protein FliM [Anaerosalibacter massiliensis]